VNRSTPAAGTPPPRFSFGKVRMSCVSMTSAVDVLFAAIGARRGGYIACTCAHGIVDSERDARLPEILNRSLMTLPDGMPTVWVGRAKGMPVSRVTAPDFLEAVLRDPRATSVRHYFYGASRQTLDRIVERAGGLAGHAAIAGAHCPPMRPAGTPETAEVLDAIAAQAPDVIWVGLGWPKQELWMAHHAARFPNAVMIGVGAAFDWFAGTTKRAPKWVQGLGLEWAHRVACEPTRLWPRYREIVPKALAMLLKEMTAVDLRRRDAA